MRIARLQSIQYVQDLANEKGAAILSLLRQTMRFENPLVVAADTTVVLGKNFLANQHRVKRRGRCCKNFPIEAILSIPQ